MTDVSNVHAPVYFTPQWGTTANILQSAEIGELATALSAAQGEFESVAKTADNPFFKSKYAALPDVVKAATPILARHGLAVWQGPTTQNGPEGGESLWTVVLHKSGQYIGSAMEMRPVKNDPQAQGSAITYARRYAYMAALGLVADEDDDGEAASGRPKPASAQQSRSKPTTRTRSAKPASEPEKRSDGLITDDTLKELGRAYKAAGIDAARLKAVFAEAGAEGKKPDELTEDQAVWIVLKLQAIASGVEPVERDRGE